MNAGIAFISKISVAWRYAIAVVLVVLYWACICGDCCGAVFYQ